MDTICAGSRTVHRSGQFTACQGVHFVLIYQESPDFGPDFLILPDLS
jgi:hypothetical protein